MNILIKRLHRNQDSVDGALSIDGGLKICDTAEHSATSLPPGTYPVIIHRCKHYRRKMPLICLENNTERSDSNRVRSARITNTPKSSCLEGSTLPLCDKCPSMPYVGNNSTLPKYCPMLKIGNGIHNRTDGSIIIGERITWGCMKHPVEHFNRLIDRLDKAQNRGECITLTIKEK